jgi:hypothetical protein
MHMVWPRKEGPSSTRWRPPGGTAGAVHRRPVHLLGRGERSTHRPPRVARRRPPGQRHPPEVPRPPRADRGRPGPADPTLPRRTARRPLARPRGPHPPRRTVQREVSQPAAVHLRQGPRGRRAVADRRRGCRTPGPGAPGFRRSPGSGRLPPGRPGCTVSDWRSRSRSPTTSTSSPAPRLLSRRYEPHKRVGR